MNPGLTLVNPGFEAPVLPDGGIASGAGSGWTIAGFANLSTDGSPYTSGNPDAPEGRQVGVLHGAGSFGQQVQVSTAGVYRLSLMAAQRGDHQPGGYHDFAATVDGVPAATFRPAGTAYERLEATLTLASGTRAIALAGIDTAGAAAGAPPELQNVSFIDDVRLERVAPSSAAIAGGGFEVPWVGPAGDTSYAYRPSGSDWSFEGESGIAADGSGFTAANPGAPEGGQVGFIQRLGSISQAVEVSPGAAGVYRLTFLAAQRGNYQLGGYHDFAVTVDGQPASVIRAAGPDYGEHAVTLSLGAGTRTIGFVGLNSAGGDNTSFLDDVRLQRVEPAGPDGRLEVIIPAGAAGATVGIVPVDDGVPEGIESVVLVLTAGAYAVGTPGMAVVEIADSPSPGGLTTVAISSTALVLSWRDIAGEAGYRVERSHFGFDWAPIGSVAADVTSFTIGGLSEGDVRRYRVVAFDGAGDFLPSAPVYGVVAWSAPVIVGPASAGPSVVTGTKTTLSALGAVAAGEATLRYTWSVVSMPAGALHPAFDENGTNAAKTTTATFSMAGDYAFRVEVANGSRAVTGEVSVRVEQTIGKLEISPGYAVVRQGESRRFRAEGRDQFGNTMHARPMIEWFLDDNEHYVRLQSDGTLIVDDLLYQSFGRIYISVVTRANSSVRCDIWAGAAVDIAPRSMTPELVAAAPISAQLIQEGVYLDGASDHVFGWVSRQNTPLSLEESLTRTNIIDDGYFDLGRGAIVELTFAPGVASNGDGADLGIFYSSTDYELSTDYDNFSTRHRIRSPERRVGPIRPYYHGGGTDNNEFFTGSWYRAIDLSSLGIPHGGSVNAVRVYFNYDAPRPYYPNFEFGDTRVSYAHAGLFGVGVLARDDLFVPHRTGGHLGQAVAQATKRGGDPNQYIILTNNDYEEDPLGGRRDNANETATIPVSNGPGLDDDLAKFTIKQLPPGFTNGRVEIALSHREAVRLFQSDGSLLYHNRSNKGGGTAISLDLNRPSGPLANLTTGDVDIWLEGTESVPDFVFAVVYRARNGDVIAADEVHMTIADWTFRGYHGEEVAAVAPVWKEALLAATRREDAGITADPEGAFFKAHIAGLPAGAVSQLQVSSDAEPSDYYFDEFVDLPDRAVSRSFAALYSADRVHLADPDAPVTAAERDAIKQALDLNVVHNPGMTAVLTTADDIHQRTLSLRGIVEITLNKPDGIYEVGDRIQGTVSRGGFGWFYWVGLSDGQKSGQNPTSFDFAASTTGYVTLTVSAINSTAATPGSAPPLFATSILIRVQPAGIPMPVWEKAAWDELKVNGYVPGDPIQRNRRISKLYAEMYNSNSAVFKWAGMAAHASYLVGDAMATAARFAAAGIVPRVPDPMIGLKLLAEGNLDVYDDMYRQMLAYRDGGGIAAIQQMRANFEIEQEQLEAWELIEQGRQTGNQQLVWEGNQGLLEFEQRVTLQNGAYAANRQYWDDLTNAWFPVKGYLAPMPSPIPGDESVFQSFRTAEDAAGVPDNASIGDFDARWAWIIRRQLPAYQTWSVANPMIDVNKLLNGGYKKR